MGGGCGTGAQATWGLLMADGRKPNILNPKP